MATPVCGKSTWLGPILPKLHQQEDLGERSPKTQARAPNKARRQGKNALLKNSAGAAPRTPLLFLLLPFLSLSSFISYPLRPRSHSKCDTPGAKHQYPPQTKYGAKICYFSKICYFFIEQPSQNEGRRPWALLLGFTKNGVVL